MKTRKEAKLMALMDAIASAKARVDNLKSSVEEQRTKNSEYAGILSQHSLGIDLFLNLRTATTLLLSSKRASSWLFTFLHSLHSIHIFFYMHYCNSLILVFSWNRKGD